MSAHDARLASDYSKVQKLVESAKGRLTIESAKGRPPYEYVLEYRVRSIVDLNSDQPIYGSSHKVLVRLPANYPVGQPFAEMLTPLFHPHVFPSRVICIGRKWMPSEFLDLFVKRIGFILCYDPDYFDFDSPANKAAMQWARRHMKLFPTDSYAISEAKPSVQWKEIRHVEWKNR